MDISAGVHFLIIVLIAISVAPDLTTCYRDITSFINSPTVN